MPDIQSTYIDRGSLEGLLIRFFIVGLIVCPLWYWLRGIYLRRKWWNGEKRPAPLRHPYGPVPPPRSKKDLRGPGILYEREKREREKKN